MQNIRTLEFEVKQQNLNKKRGCDFSRIVAGTSGYLRAKFYFSEEWNGCAKVASFESSSVEGPQAILLDYEDSCDIPAEVLKADRFEVSVLGGKNNMRINTNKYKVRQMEVT